MDSGALYRQCVRSQFESLDKSEVDVSDGCIILIDRDDLDLSPLRLRGEECFGAAHSVFDEKCFGVTLLDHCLFASGT